ncbi:hypothetical protein NHP21005_02150 [Helicobacter sp. NHP21005]|uniref:hypothetical protein n=1 Tax=Helicobacter felistomachi TaxID=3040201 RepID=UPI0025724A70|nr:hypothetical protein [Helicobacter sp. NHP21005]BEG56527.1 hypothetical protein NHP21005_02150 [Helicobacter sp. NHP21005]
MSVYAQMQSLSNDALLVVQDTYLLEGASADQALQILNKTLLGFKGDLDKEGIYVVRGMHLAYLKHPKQDNIGRACFAVFVYDKNESLEAVGASALVLGFGGDILERLKALDQHAKKGLKIKKVSLLAALMGGLGALVAFATHTLTHKG